MLTLREFFIITENFLHGFRTYLSVGSGRGDCVHKLRVFVVYDFVRNITREVEVILRHKNRVALYFATHTPIHVPEFRVMLPQFHVYQCLWRYSNYIREKQCRCLQDIMAHVLTNCFYVKLRCVLNVQKRNPIQGLLKRRR